MNGGIRVGLITGDGKLFDWRYAREEIDVAMEAIKNLAMRQTKHYSISLEPCDAPPPPMTLERWVEIGNTLD